jgi:hypothetical protein
VTITGCAAGVDPGPTPESGRAGRPTTTLSDTQSSADEIRQVASTHVGGREETPGEIYRDTSSFVYRDGGGHQVLEQWLIDESGSAYWNRACRVADKGGVQWNNCTSWDIAHDIADLGLPSFGPIAGMNTYVWSEPVAGNRTAQRLAQTVFNERGDMRMGRVCPIERVPLWDECTDWKKLAIETEKLDIPGASAVRDDSYFSYTNADSDSVIVQSVLSIDGSLMWDRSCVTESGSPLVSSFRCGFGTRTPLREFGIRPVAVAGSGQYVYQDGLKQVLSQTLISVDGTKAYHRSCEVTQRGVEWTECEPFTATTISQLRITQAPL